jgi:hypothetical protein
MNERVPDSSGLPLRAMVMVLLFLGVVFLLVGFQAMGSGKDASDDSTSVSTVTTSAAATSTTSAAPAPQADVRVFNISDVAGAADRAATRLRDAGWNVTETGNLTLPDVTATTVYFGNAEGEQAAAEEVGKLLDAPVAPRIPDVADQPPGVIVVVTG